MAKSVRSLLLVGEAHDQQGSVGLRLPQPLEGGQLGRLGLGHLNRVEVSQGDLRHGGQEPQHQRHVERLPGELPVFTSEQEPGGQTHDEERPGHQRAVDGVQIAWHRRGVEDRRPEVDELGAPVHDLEARRGLLPGVGDHDPEAREGRAHRDHQAREPVHPLRQAPLAVEHDPQEAGFEKEGEYPFGGQGCTEDVADEAGIPRPVHAELELHRDAGRHSDREAQGEDPDPEARHSLIDRLARPQVAGEHPHDHPRHSDRDDRKDVVEPHRQGELDSRQQYRVHGVSPSRLMGVRIQQPRL